MSEREPLAPGRITSTKPDDSERDYRDCVDRMDDFERRHVGSPGRLRRRADAGAGAMSVDRMGRIGQVLGELQADVAVLVTALQMIEQGYVFKGSERHDLDMDMARLIARDALGAVEK